MKLSFRTTDNAGTRFLQGYRPKRVFVFGAGLSVPVGLPVANSLLQRAYAWNALKKNNTSLLNAFCDHFYPGLNRSAGDLPDAEDLLGMMDAAKEYDGVRGRGRGYRWRTTYINNAQSQLIRLIGEFLWSFQIKEVIRKLSYIQNIVRRNSADTVFVTFNYDLLLETALTLEGIDFSYAIEKSDSHRVVVLKPHGSINWSYPSQFKRCRDWQQTKCKQFLNKIYVYSEIFPDFLTERINPPYVIIAPTPHKQIEDFFLKKQWTSFSSAVHSARNISIVGYSLPNADRLARIVLRRAVDPNDTSKIIEVIDPADLLEHYQELISPQVRYIKDRCENFFS